MSPRPDSPTYATWRENLRRSHQASSKKAAPRTPMSMEARQRLSEQRRGANNSNFGKVLGRPIVNGQRQCTICNDWKVLADFATDRSRPAGVRPACRECERVRYGLRRLAHNYRVEPDYLEDLYEAQGGKCAICRRALQFLGRATHVDHRSGQVCGLLCRRCNQGLGHFNDNAELLDAATHYLVSSARALRVVSGGCSSCGCGELENTHGDVRHIVLSEIKAAARAASISPEQAVANMWDAVKMSYSEDAPKDDQWISDKIALLKGEGKGTDEAIATAYALAGRAR